MYLPHYMDANFPALRLEPPLFYNWPIAIRFELNGDEPKMPGASDSYFAAVVRRANRIFEETFRNSEYALVVSTEMKFQDLSPDAYRWKYRDRRKKTPDLFRLARAHGVGLSRPAGRATTCRVRGKERETMTLRWSECSPLRIGYTRIFEAIANQDFPRRKPRVLGDVYFVDPKNHLILHMYDDRGMDVIAKDVTTLRRLYSAKQAWILDYDRQRIDNTFHPGGQQNSSSSPARTPTPRT